MYVKVIYCVVCIAAYAQFSVGDGSGDGSSPVSPTTGPATTSTYKENTMKPTKETPTKYTAEETKKDECWGVDAETKKAAWDNWVTAFRNWQVQFERYQQTGAGKYSQSGYNFYGSGPNNVDWSGASQPKSPIEKLVKGFDFIDQTERKDLYAGGVAILEGAMTRLQYGLDMRHVANDLIEALWTNNGVMRKDYETKAALKEALCRIINSPKKEEAIEMMKEWANAIKSQGKVDMVKVLDKVIRKSILTAINEEQFGKLMQKVFMDNADMPQKLAKRMLELVGLDSAKPAFVEFSIEVIGSYVKSQAGEMKTTMQRFIKNVNGTASMDTIHILTAVLNLTGEFTHEVVDNLVDILKDPMSVKSPGKKISHMIEDFIKFDKNGNFTADLKKLLAADSKNPISGMPLKALLFLIQPDRENCDLSGLVQYIPKQEPQMTYPDNQWTRPYGQGVQQWPIRNPMYQNYQPQYSNNYQQSNYRQYDYQKKYSGQYYPGSAYPQYNERGNYYEPGRGGSIDNRQQNYNGNYGW